METWYVQITRHLESGEDVEELFMTDVCAKEFGSEKEAQRFITRWLDPENNQLAPGERALPSYMPVTAAMFNVS